MNEVLALPDELLAGVGLADWAKEKYELTAGSLMRNDSWRGAHWVYIGRGVSAGVAYGARLLLAGSSLPVSRDNGLASVRCTA